MTHYQRTTCRACSDQNLKLILALGPTPLANSFLHSPDEFATELSYPLDLYFCQSCGLVQLLDVIDPETLFRHYIYATGSSETIAAHHQNYAKTVVDLLGLGPADRVIEVASNDGSLLKCFRAFGVKTLGVEPATNLAEYAREQGLETINQFFNAASAAQIRASHGLAKAVIANNVLAHVDETQDFLRGCKTLLSPSGLVIIEAPYLKEFVDRLEYDTVYHEHLCYFSVTTLMRLCDEVGLSIRRVDQVPVHGGSLRVYAGRQEAYNRHSQPVYDLAAAEQQAGLNQFGRYQRFAAAVEANRRELLKLLRALKAEGKTIAAYGAPAKGNTLLNYCGIGPDLVSYTVDRSALKVGLYTPGMHLPVLPTTTLLEQQPDYVLILAWNLAEEIMRQQQAYHKLGGKFIIPLPQPRVV
jgi:hypothetical protein